MKFESMLTFWKMQGNMIMHNSCLTRSKIYESTVEHVVYSMIVGNRNMHANIMYRYEELDGQKSKFALVYCDILFGEFPRFDSAGAQLFKKNATVGDLSRHLIE